MSDKKYWIWLSQALGAGARVDEILSAFPEPEKLYFADDAERMTAGVFTRRQLERLNKTKLSDAETATRVCAKNGWEICVPTDGDYPEELKRLADMPLVLYVDGDISRIKDKISIGIVARGSRHMTAPVLRAPWRATLPRRGLPSSAEALSALTAPPTRELSRRAESRSASWAAG